MPILGQSAGRTNSPRSTSSRTARSHPDCRSPLLSLNETTGSLGHVAPCHEQAPFAARVPSAWNVGSYGMASIVRAPSKAASCCRLRRQSGLELRSCSAAAGCQRPSGSCGPRPSKYRRRMALRWPHPRAEEPGCEARPTKGLLRARHRGAGAGRAQDRALAVEAAADSRQNPLRLACGCKGPLRRPHWSPCDLRPQRRAGLDGGPARVSARRAREWTAI